MTNESYFLSKANPIANTDQRDMEDRAIRILARPELERPKMTVGYLLREVMKHELADQMDRFDQMVDEYVFHYVMRYVASDGQYPGVLRFMTPPHHWFGRDVPGSRWGADCPDFCYRIIPVSHDGRYEIRGEASCENPPTAHFALMGNNTAAPQIITLLDSVDMDLDDEGGFVLTVDAEPANGRRNHIQSTPEALQLWIRDALGDWQEQVPYALTVTRLNPPVREALTDEEIAQQAARAMLDGVYYTYFISRFTTSFPPNVAEAPGSSAAMGGMATQYTAKAHVVLAQDEALVIRASSAGALFRDVVLTSVFNMSLNYWNTTSSLNHAQMAPDADGLFTYVVAHKDPGVHNWLDTNGLPQLTVGHRWQSFPGGSAGEAPQFTVKLVRFGNLEGELPQGVARIDEAGRKAQIAARANGFAQRFTDT